MNEAGIVGNVVGKNLPAQHADGVGGGGLTHVNLEDALGKNFSRKPVNDNPICFLTGMNRHDVVQSLHEVEDMSPHTIGVDVDLKVPLSADTPPADTPEDGSEALEECAYTRKKIVFGIDAGANRNISYMMKAHHVAKFLGRKNFHEGTVEEVHIVLQASVHVHIKRLTVEVNLNCLGVMPVVVVGSGGDASASNKEDIGQQIEDEAEIVGVGLPDDANITRACLFDSARRDAHKVHAGVNHVVIPIILRPLLIEAVWVVE